MAQRRWSDDPRAQVRSGATPIDALQICDAHRRALRDRGAVRRVLSELRDRRRRRAASGNAIATAPELEIAHEQHEPAIHGDPGGFVVERPRADPGDLALRMVGGDIDEAREEQRLAEALAAMRGPRAGRTEPAEAPVVAVV